MVGYLMGCFLGPSRLRPGPDDIHRNPPRFVAGEQLARCTAAGLFLDMNIGERLPIVVLDDEASGVRLLNVPRRWEAAARSSRLRRGALASTLAAGGLVSAMLCRHLKSHFAIAGA